jgi:hypothetical protein
MVKEESMRGRVDGKEEDNIHTKKNIYRRKTHTTYAKLACILQ